MNLRNTPALPEYEIDFDLIEYELGSDIAEIIRNDVPLEKDINENDEDIGGVPW